MDRTSSANRVAEARRQYARRERAAVSPSRSRNSGFYNSSTLGSSLDGQVSLPDVTVIPGPGVEEPTSFSPHSPRSELPPRGSRTYNGKHMTVQDLTASSGAPGTPQPRAKAPVRNAPLRTSETAGNENNNNVSDAKKEYVQNLKQQIKYLEMECQVLKENQPINTRKSGKSSVGHSASLQAVAAAPAQSLDISFSNLKAQYTSLQASHREELAAMESLHKRQRDEIATLRSKTSDLELKLARSASHHKEEMETLKDDLKHQLEEGELAKQRNVSLMEQARVDKENRQSLEASMMALETQTSKEIWELTNEAQRATKLANDTQNRVNELEQEVGKKQFAFEKLEKDCQDIIDKGNSYNTEINSLKATVTQLRSELSKATYQLERANKVEQDLRQECNSLSQELATKTGELQRLSVSLAEVTSREHELLKDREQVVTLREELVHKTETIAQQGRAAQARADEEMHQRQQTAAKLAEARARESDAQRKLQLAESSEASLVRRVEEIEKDLAKTLAELNLSRTTCKRTEEHLETLKRDCVHYKSCLARAEAELGDLREQVSLQHSVEELSQTLDQDNFRSLLEKNLELVSTLDKLKMRGAHHSGKVQPTDDNSSHDSAHQDAASPKQTWL